MTSQNEVQSASELISGIKGEFTEKDGVVYGPNGSPMGKAVKAKPASPKAKAKPASKPTTPAKTTAKASTNGKAKGKKAAKGRERTTGGTEKPVGDRRLAVVKFLRKVGATSATSGKTADDIAAKTGLTRFDAYGQVYHTHFLQAGGFVKQAKLEGVRGNTYYLTAKGQKAADADIAG